MIRRTRDTGCQEVVGDAALLVPGGTRRRSSPRWRVCAVRLSRGSAIDAAGERLIKRFGWDGVIAQHSTVYAQGSKGPMRFRLLGEHVHVSIAVLSIIEFAVCSVAFILAALVRFDAGLAAIARTNGALAPRTLTFSLSMMICLLSFGLYSDRQRARAFGIVLRVGAAVAAAIAVTPVIYYLIPTLWIGRGVIALAFAGSILGITLTRTAFSRGR
jgi:hypothetical protein